MALPKQVQEAADKADELMKQINEPDPEVNTEDVPKVEDAPAHEEPPKPEVNAETVETLQHKLSVLQGKYDKEVKALKDDITLLNRLKSENRSFKEQVAQLQQANSELSNLVKDLEGQIVTKPSVSEKPNLDVLTDEDRQHLDDEDLGGKTLEIIWKLARAAAGPNDQITKQISDLRGEFKTVQDTAAQSAQASFTDRLDTAVRELDAKKDFATINSDPKWMDWLDTEIELNQYTGEKAFRRDLLQDAFNRKDITALKRGISEFLKETQPKPKQQPTNRLEKELEPGPSDPAQPSNVHQGKIWTNKEIKQFYDDYSKGVYKGREAEAAAKDKDIVLAAQQGRVRQS